MKAQHWLSKCITDDKGRALPVPGESVLTPPWSLIRCYAMRSLTMRCNALPCSFIRLGS